MSSLISTDNLSYLVNSSQFLFMQHQFTTTTCATWHVDQVQDHTLFTAVRDPTAPMMHFVYSDYNMKILWTIASGLLKPLLWQLCHETSSQPWQTTVQHCTYQTSASKSLLHSSHTWVISLKYPVVTALIWTHVCVAQWRSKWGLHKMQKWASRSYSFDFS